MLSPWGHILWPHGKIDLCSLHGYDIISFWFPRGFIGVTSRELRGSACTKGTGQSSSYDKGRVEQRLHMPSWITREQCKSLQQEDIMSAFIKRSTRNPPVWLHQGGLWRMIAQMREILHSLKNLACPKRPRTHQRTAVSHVIIWICLWPTSSFNTREEKRIIYS